MQIEALRVAGDEVLDAGDLRRAQHRPVVGERRPERDVVAHRAVEQEHVLQHAADVAPQVGRVELAQVGAVDQHRALVGLVEPQHQLLDRRLAGADAADQPDPLARLDDEGDAVERRELLPGIAEGDVLERDLAAQLGTVQEAARGRPLDRQRHDLVERIERGARLVVAGQDARDLGERRHRPAGDDGAGDQRADRQQPLADAIDAEDHHPDA